MKQVTDQSELDAALGWLRAFPSGDDYAGYWPKGWEASTWIIHAVYERREGVTAAEAPNPTVDEETHHYSDYLSPPAHLWRRLRYRDYAASIPDEAVGWSTWQAMPLPIHVVGPDHVDDDSLWFPFEGVIDQLSLTRLVELLTATSEQTGDVYAFWSGALSGDRYLATELWRGDLRGLPALIEPDGPRARALGQPWVRPPANIWPSDRSWCITSDWDQDCTLVQGPQALIDLLRADDVLETIDSADDW